MRVHIRMDSTMTKPGPTVSQAYDPTHIYGKRTFNYLFFTKQKILNKPGKVFLLQNIWFTCFKLFIKVFRCNGYLQGSKDPTYLSGKVVVEHLSCSVLT